MEKVTWKRKERFSMLLPHGPNAPCILYSLCYQARMEHKLGLYKVGSLRNYHKPYMNYIMFMLKTHLGGNRDMAVNGLNMAEQEDEETVAGDPFR